MMTLFEAHRHHPFTIAFSSSVKPTSFELKLHSSLCLSLSLNSLLLCSSFEPSYTFALDGLEYLPLSKSRLIDTMSFAERLGLRSRGFENIIKDIGVREEILLPHDLGCAHKTWIDCEDHDVVKLRTLVQPLLQCMYEHH